MSEDIVSDLENSMQR